LTEPPRKKNDQCQRGQEKLGDILHDSSTKGSASFSVVYILNKTNQFPSAAEDYSGLIGWFNGPSGDPQP
jgi:hypothetical protein